MCSAPRLARVIRLRESYRIGFELMRLRFHVPDVGLVLSQPQRHVHSGTVHQVPLVDPHGLDHVLEVP